MDLTRTETGSSDGANPALTPSDSSPATPSVLSRNASFSNGGLLLEEWETFPSSDKLSVFDLLGNFTLPQRFEQWQSALSVQKDKVRRHQERIKSGGVVASQMAYKEWKKRVPSSDEQLEKYRRRVKTSVDRFSGKWNDAAAVTLREKMSFIAGVLNVFISGYLIGAQPAHFYYWFTAQLCYFMPIRFYTYHKKGYHYFLADLCYFVNLLAIVSIWIFPGSKRLFISTYCLAYGNNAIAIAMWRNSMVFHSLDKVTSLFIHIMPPVTLHTLVHLTPAENLQTRFPAVYAIKFSAPNSPQHYSLVSMLLWSTVPYVFWQAMYHIFITVRRREKIAAGRPTSFTWLRRTYSKVWLGKLVLALPENLQEFAFMFIQYSYSCLTILPCPVWFWYRWPSALFLLSVFGWSIYNGATYYIDVFGKKFQNELEALKRDVAKLQNSPEAGLGASPPLSGVTEGVPSGPGHSGKKGSLDQIPLLDSKVQTGSTSVDLGSASVADRKQS